MTEIEIIRGCDRCGGELDGEPGQWMICSKCRTGNQTNKEGNLYMTEQLSMDVGPCTSKPVFPAGFYKGRPRPNRMSDEVLAEVANRLMPRVLQWLNMGQDNAEEVLETAKDLINVLEYSSDGYKMAKELEDRHGWDEVDSDLVDILEGADYYGTLQTALRAWVKDNDLKPRLEVGEVVTVKKVSSEGSEHRGEIVNIGDDGTYTVMIPALGHVRQGTGPGVIGTIFAWEAVEGWNQ